MAFISESDVIIFNHIPKTGGTSIIKMFREVYGEDKCFRHRRRDSKTDKYTPAITSVDRADLDAYKFVAGHFFYGNHKLFDARVKYISVVRDPLERLISDYYFNRRIGRADRKEMARSMSLEDYIVFKLGKPNSNMTSSSQVKYVSAKETFIEAAEVIRQNYFCICTMPQLNDMQGLLARAIGRPDLAPRHDNKSKDKRPMPSISPEIVDQLMDRFAEDIKLYRWTEAYFNEAFKSEA
ncbi:MAG: sulfotransferase family protein [Oceanicaulis sp.]|nr:sulfotransferase family protein [Oceanicaulis sp.]